ncbi:hypothetical protein PITC_031850 [Penicillium italicum]|uniref:Uncharacterized protein n=1 Tax=Penicillium italicum TaxID=40296 RepID=A0A0A2L4B8_PENIT|nr:hypothetical protein PITC_031850 [Penicillium italicum]
MTATKQTLEHLNQRQESDEESCILDWLSAVDYTSQQRDLLDRRQEGTGQRLLASEECTHWLCTPRATLFCPGIPCAGKTICSAIVVGDLTSRFEDKQDVGIAYIYCNFNRQDKQRAQDLISSLLKQLSKRRTSVPEAVKDLYKRYKTALTQINHLFKGGAFLEIQAHEDDIRRYLNGNMFKLPGFVNRNTTMQEEIMTVISHHVQGMFLLAQLYFESLIGRRSAKSIRTALKEFSKEFNDYTYDKAYDNAMSRIQGQLSEQTELAMQTLSWLACARRPLTSLELQHALAIEEGESSLDAENLSGIEDIHAVCAGLVTVENESGVIRLVHYTTQEYLERKKELLFPSAENKISALCITYISFDTSGSGICESDEAFEERLQSYPFYPYVVRHWDHHLKPAGNMRPDLMNFLKDQAKFDASEQAIHVSRHSSPNDWSQNFPRQKTGLHVAAYRGIEEAVSYFLQDQSAVNSCYNGGWTALKWAILIAE